MMMNFGMCCALCHRWWRGSAKLLKQLTGAPLEVAEAVRQQLQEFQQHVPLISALRNPGLRDRHWEKISAAVGCPVKADAGGQARHYDAAAVQF
jgi:dynein heavy chain